MDGFVSLEVQKITFLIFKSLTLRQITVLYRKIKCGFCYYRKENEIMLRLLFSLTTILTTITHFWKSQWFESTSPCALRCRGA